MHHSDISWGGGPFLLGFYIDYLFIIILVIFLSYGFLFSY